MDTLRFHHADRERGPSVGVIAEIGVNHDGSIETAERLIDAAKTAGADAVKFQYFDPATLLSGDGTLASYQRGKADSARQMLERLRLGPDELVAAREYTRGLGLDFVVTPFSVRDVATLAATEVDAVKIASPDAVNPWLLEAAAGLGKPMWVSTGTCGLAELTFAAELLGGHTAGGGLLHCVSAYPTPVEQAGLGGIGAMREWLHEGLTGESAARLAVGYSDHTRSTEAGGWAVLAGACVLEKHLTHDRAASGPDHAASLEPAEFASYVANAKRAVAALGPVDKRCTEAERDVRAVSRQSLAYTRDLPAGHVLRRTDLETRRPGTGVPAAQGPAWVGRTLARPVTQGTLADEGDAVN
ncbi:MAG: N-acetylneuraminate synthase family protein [Planctomycetota bacterium]